jgi:trehalose-phosphatase
MKKLWNEWPKLKKTIAGKRQKLLFLDFDGTLAPIASTPDQVVFEEETKKHLRRLCRKPDYKIAIISGRSMKDLKTFLSMRDILYIGNHGLEMAGKGPSLPGRAKKAKELKFLMWQLVEKLNADYYYMPGVLIEDKGITVSLHYRNVDKENLPLFNEVLNFFRNKYKKAPIVWKKGKKVWEIFPKIQWHKGYAALYIFKKYPKSIPIVIGDDRTDEDMFRALSRFGITIRVGHSKKSHAEYYVNSQNEIEKLLEELCS